MIVIIGAGPTGLAAGYELGRLGCEDFVILERANDAGGLAGSVTEHGYTWDHGGHVVFSHYGEFDKLMAEVMGDDVEHHDRSSFVRHGSSWVPYPFQDHPRYLLPDEVLRVIEGLLGASNPPPGADLGTWARQTLGDGIYDLFYEPYNRKVWSTPLSEMSSTWVADRVSTPDIMKLLRNIITGEDSAWGPNATFTFPSHGGTGEIWRRLADRLTRHIRYGLTVDVVCPRLHEVVADEHTFKYDILINTMPLDKLVGLTNTTGQATLDLPRAAGQLRHNHVLVAGVGVNSLERPDWSWTYYPEPRSEVPFYRVTNFAKYAAANTPAGRSSFLTEISFAPEEPATEMSCANRVVDALVNLDLIRRADVEELYFKHLPYAYPVPTLGRDNALRVLLPWFEAHDILSRGRFGAWRYEIANQDHSVMQGFEAARRAYLGTPEHVVYDGLM